MNAAALPPRAETLKLGMWLFLATEVMTFGGFLASYIVLRTANAASMAADAGRLDVLLATINTVILIGSSLTMALGVAAAQAGDVRGARRFLLATIVLACGFLVLKGLEYGGKFHHGIGPWTSIFFSCYFTLTGLHGVHVLAGIVLLGVLAARAPALVAERSGAFESAGLYWHFVDVVWIFLFPLLYLL